MTKYKSEAAYIIQTLRAGLDYSQINGTMLAIMQLVEDHQQNDEWAQCEHYCQELEQLAEDAELKNVSRMDTNYMRGVAKIYRGTFHRDQGEIETAIQCFSTAQHLFHWAKARRNEAVSFLAMGIAYQEQGKDKKDLNALSDALKMLQCSLVILRRQQDNLRFDVRNKLAEVRGEFQKNLGTRKFFWHPSKPVQTQKVRGRAKGIPIYDAAAGPPVLTEEPEEFITIDEITDRIAFALRVHGDSLINDGILSNDLLLVEEKREDLLEGQIVAVTTKERESEEFLMIKKYYKEKDHIRLEPANENEPFVIITSSELSRTIGDRYSRTTDVYSEEEAEIIGGARILIRRNIGKTKE